MVLATFSVRAFSIWLFSGRRLSPLTMRALALVPVAVLSAICGPLIFHPSGNWESPFGLIEFWAALASMLVARHGMLPSILLGMGVYAIGKLIN
jgi:branched-subunit amino acid transport protein